MPAKLNPPFRADHVGSLLRPARLQDARRRKAAGEITGDALRAVEDACIRDVVALQAEIGGISISSRASTVSSSARRSTRRRSRAATISRRAPW